MIADHLGHSRVSLTQDVYLGRRASDAGSLTAPEAWHVPEDPPKRRTDAGPEVG
jgi:hypothetical protein